MKLPSGAELVLWLHVMAASVWIGGQILLGAIAPIVARQGDVMKLVARRFAAVAWPAFAILVITGLVNMHNAGLDWSALPRTAVGRTLEVKLGLVLLSGAAAAFHTRLAGAGPGTAALRGLLGGLSLLAAVLAALFGVVIAQS